MYDLHLYSVTVIFGNDYYYFDKWAVDKAACINDIQAMFKSAGCSDDIIKMFVDKADPDER